MALTRALLLCLAFALSGCASSLPPLKTVEKVDLARFMGPWYVIACIPTWFETEVYNGVESYRLEPDGTIDTVFTFRKGSFDGPEKKINPRGFVVDKVNNSTWGMRFVWPFKAEYLITHLDGDYSRTVVGRNKRDHVWIMARKPRIPEEDYQGLLRELAAQGYDVTKMRRVPQRWPDGGK
jgi:apolipoprotein D and lipocalin family protein